MADKRPRSPQRTSYRFAFVIAAIIAFLMGLPVPKGMEATLRTAVVVGVLYLLVWWLYLTYVILRSARPTGPDVCPSCQTRFTPEPTGSWTTQTKCLDGRDYCSPCKATRRCGCGS